MTRLEELKRHLRPGGVYRRGDLAKWSKSVDRHLRELVDQGVLEKLRRGLYHCPRESAYGRLPPKEQDLLRAFLKDDNFLVTCLHYYNGLGVGTTQMYNLTLVYNRKRHGRIKLAGRSFNFCRKPRIPKKFTKEFLYVDLINNIDMLVEDRAKVRERALVRVKELDPGKFRRAVNNYGTLATRKFFSEVLANAA